MGRKNKSKDKNKAKDKCSSDCNSNSNSSSNSSSLDCKNTVEIRLSAVEKLLRSIAESLQRAHFYDYIQYVSDEKRMLKRSFLLGMLKGVGTAIGFSLLGALAIYILHLIAESNLPYIANFISDIIDIINGTGK